MRWKIASWPRQGPTNFIGYSLSSDIIGLDGLAFPDSPFKYIRYRHNHSRNTSGKEVGIRKYEIENQKSEIQNPKSEVGNRFRIQKFRKSELEFGILSYELEIRFHAYVNYFNLVLTSIKFLKCKCC